VLCRLVAEQYAVLVPVEHEEVTYVVRVGAEGEFHQY
jgi:hypothetical protein